jgi:hypothetical protein
MKKMIIFIVGLILMSHSIVNVENKDACCILAIVVIMVNDISKLYSYIKGKVSEL